MYFGTMEHTVPTWTDWKMTLEGLGLEETLRQLGQTELSEDESDDSEIVGQEEAPELKQYNPGRDNKQGLWDAFGTPPRAG